MVAKVSDNKVVKYKWRVGIRKGLYASAAATVGIASALEVIGGASALTSASSAVIIGAAIGGIRVAVNWWKINYRTGCK